MSGKKSQIHKWFEEDEKGLETDSAKKMESFRLLGREIEQKQMSPKASDMEILRMQIKFMSKRVLLCQLLLFVLLLGVFVKLGSSLEDVNLYLLGALAASLFSVFLALACAQEERNHMAELAGSCYFNHKQVCILSMLLCGGINLFFLSAVIFYTSSITTHSLLQVGIYVLVPYLCTGCLHFLVMLAGRGRNAYLSIAVSGVMIAIGSSVIPAFPEVYAKAAIGIWVMGFVLFGGIYMAEIVCIIRQMDRGERLCMN